MNRDYSQGVLDGLQTAYNAISPFVDTITLDILDDLIQEAYEHV